MNLKAVVFDLDGVITDTAELHYRAWQRLADEEGLPFNRKINERLRGVSRRDSLLVILAGQDETEERIQEMMARKNGYYGVMLDKVTPDYLLPGALELMDDLDEARVPYAIASASKNARTVCELLGIADRLAALVDGYSVKRQKPNPDLFRYAAAKINCPPDQCLVVEDAAAGIAAAIAAGMPALAIGPADRFEGLIGRKDRIARRDDLRHLTLAELQQMGVEDETWVVAQEEFKAASQRHMETVFTIGNGYFASRGSLEEGYPGDHPLSLAHGIFDDVPVSFSELVNLPAWQELELRVDEQPFRLDKGHILHFRRYLNLYQGILRREVRWQSPNGMIVDLSFERFASYAEEHGAGLRVLVTAVNRPCTISLHTGINGHVANDDLLHWHLLDQGQVETGVVWLHSRTRQTSIELAAAAKVESSMETTAVGQQCPGQPSISVGCQLDEGQTLAIDKVVGFTASRDSIPDAADVVDRALQIVHAQSYDELRRAQQEKWAQLWQDCDVIIEGDDEAQLAVRFNLFQLLIAAPQNDDRVSIGAKTLSGLGYRGHVFWDTEIFILPFFIHTKPELARNMLLYRYHTLPGARQKAADNGYEGAQYAWESAATGEEVTPTWVPHFSDRTKMVRIWTGDIQIHISADIAYAIIQYWRTTGDDDFMRDYGVEMILDTARFWASRAELEEGNGQRLYAYRDVIGPDEYHDHIDNNSFTNYLSRWHLQTGMELLEWLKTNHPAKARQLIADLQITDVALSHWLDVIEHTIFLYDAESGLIDQFENFFDLQHVSPEFIAQASRSLQVIFGIEGANERQVLKQADVIMLLCLFHDQFDRRTWQKNWDVYMPKTDHNHGSSLGPSFHAWAACEMERPAEAYEHFMLAALADLRDPRGNARDGIHGASAGGVWQALAFGFAGLHLTEEGYTVEPRLPAHWRRLAFKYYWHGKLQEVDIQAP